MGLRVTDAVVADHDLTNTVTGHAVTRGAPVVVLKQDRGERDKPWEATRPGPAGRCG